MSNLTNVIQDAIVGGVAYDIFSNYIKSTYEMANDFVLSQYIKLQLKNLDSAKDISEKELDSVVDAIEATIIDTPEDVKNIEDKSKQKEAFEKYFKIVNIDSFKNIENSKISVDGKSKYIEDSFKNIKDSDISI